jgi:hypothetical protein
MFLSQLGNIHRVFILLVLVVSVHLHGGLRSVTKRFSGDARVYSVYLLY